MIIIDQEVEQKLTSALEQIRDNAEVTRCLHFALRGDVKGQQEALVNAARAHIALANPQLYLCDDGDSFILSPTLLAKDARQVMLAMSDVAHKPVNETWVSFVELPVHANKVHAVIDPKIEARRKAEELHKQQQEQLAAERKRESMLNINALPSGTDIKQLRQRRAQPQLMIIEDDVFTQRLVNNVLDKKYPLTGLKDANRALETYADLAPDLLFLDINLPGVTGHELLERIIRIDPEAYVVMLSGNADRDNITQAMTKGAKGFVGKPFNREKLLQYVERCPTLHMHHH